MIEGHGQIVETQAILWIASDRQTQIVTEIDHLIFGVPENTHEPRLDSRC
jgi:hypothetical protein